MMFYWFLKKLLGYEEDKKIGDKSCQLNFDKRLSDFASFLLSYLITTVKNTVLLSKRFCFMKPWRIWGNVMRFSDIWVQPVFTQGSPNDYFSLT